MGYRIKGTTVSDAAGNPLEQGASHSDAVALGKDRAKHDGDRKSTTSLAPTARLIIALDFSDAESYYTVVDSSEAMARDVAEATDPGIVGELLARPDKDVEKAHRVEVRAKQPGHEFHDDQGKLWSGDAWAVLFPDRELHCYEPDEFSEKFTLKSKPATKADKKSAKPPKPSADSADKLAGKTKKKES